jgi:hypothetical protein
MTDDNFVLHWIVSIGLADDPNWPPIPDPAWLHRRSLFEMQIDDALDLSFIVAVKKIRRNELLPDIITRAISAMVPVDQVSNAELLHILFGGGLRGEDKRAVRNFRNEERPLKLDTAARYILDLLYAQKIQPAEGGRLWYNALVYSSGVSATNDYLKASGHTDSSLFERDKPILIANAVGRFTALWETSLRKSYGTSNPRMGIRQFMDYCAFVHLQESQVKRNPWISIRKMIDLAPIHNGIDFDIEPIPV